MQHQHRHSSPPQFRPWLAAAAVSLAAAVAEANIIHARYVGGSDFHYEITQMPDLDQLRAPAAGTPGLPNNGSMYCVPSSIMNMTLYAANHGFPELLPGPGNWQAQSRYNAATGAIAALGTLMGTDPAEGTGGAGARIGAEAWLRQSGRLTVVFDYATGFYTPRLSDLAAAGAFGGLASFCYGRYYPIGYVNGVPLWARSGGHCVTLSEAYRLGGDQYLLCRDPADEGADLFTQSQFVSRRVEVDDLPFLTQSGGGTYVRFGSALDYMPGTTEIRVIDFTTYVFPKLGYSWMPQPNGGKAIKSRRVTFPMNAPPPPSEITLNDRTLDVALGTLADGYYALVAGAGGVPTMLERIDPHTGQAAGVGIINGAERLVFGRGRELYTAGGEMLRCHELAPEFELVAERVMPVVADALAYDDATDRVWVVDAQAGRLARYPARLAGPADVFDVPPPFSLSGVITINFSPADGRLWLGCDTSPRLVWALETAPGAFSWGESLLPAVQRVDGFDFDDLGHLFISENGTLREFAPDNQGGWVEVLDSEFAGAPAGYGLRITRSRSNFNAAEHSGPGWENLPPADAVLGTPVLDARGDLNCDGVVNFADINAFVLSIQGEAAYESVFPTCSWHNGDMNYDREVNFADINLFVAALTGN